ncbi:MAG: hypothetical protein AAF267_03890 [Deinococcota bacterium]
MNTSTNIKVCAKCGKTLKNEPKHIEGIGYLGPECYRHLAGLEQLIENQFNRWVSYSEAQVLKQRFNLLGIKYNYRVNDDTDACYFTFKGFKRANSKPTGQTLTFKQIRQHFAEKLQAASLKRQQEGVA